MFFPVPGGAAQIEQRNPQTKARWNPKKEQIDILESIFDSGNNNPSRAEIQMIRTRLQEFGEVGDANVFYWFQNRKSRNRKRQRRLNVTKENEDEISPSIQTSTANPTQTNPPNPTQANTANPIQTSTTNPIQAMEKSGFPTLSASNSSFANQQIQQTQQVSADPHINMHQGGLLSGGTTYPYKYNSAISSFPQDYSSFLLPEMQSYSFDHYQSHEAAIPSALTEARPDTRVGYGNEDLLTVTINGMKYKAPNGPINVREAFGPNVIMVDTACQIVHTNEQGFSLHGLEEGGDYYLLNNPGGAAPLAGFSQL
ncbi:hypothetical protein SUGI_0754100 [Cryptomeria japonica]|nr:hypothetical protein SUGI_0754100 [Cryptomeria japonica]